jgi:hypothetical protein
MSTYRTRERERYKLQGLINMAKEDGFDYKEIEMSFVKAGICPNPKYMDTNELVKAQSLLKDLLGWGK